MKEVVIKQKDTQMAKSFFNLIFLKMIKVQIKKQKVILII